MGSPKASDHPKKRVKYSKGELEQAIVFCKSGGKMSDASKMYNIPKSTLSLKIKNGVNYISRPGPKPFLAKEAEDRLRNWIEDNGKVGSPKSMREIKVAAWGLSSNTQESDKFRTLGPSNGWFYGFIRRNPSIKRRKPEALSSASAAITYNNVQNWFTNIEQYLKEKGYFDILSDSSRVFNMDEAGFQHNSSPNMVFVEKKQQQVYHVSKNTKEQTTVLWTFIANGDVLKPHIVFSGKRVTKDLKDNSPENVTFGLTESGWMTQHHFLHYIEHIFMPQIIEKGIKLPVILFLDGHQSHESIEIAEKSRALGIILIRLYPNATHIYQPADKACFYPIKKSFEAAIKINKLCDENFLVNKKTLPRLIEKCYQLVNRETVKVAFKTCGLHPWKSTEVTEDRFITSNLTESLPQSSPLDENACRIVTTEIVSSELQHEPLNENSQNNAFIVDNLSIEPRATKYLAVEPTNAHDVEHIVEDYSTNERISTPLIEYNFDPNETQGNSTFVDTDLIKAPITTTKSVANCVDVQEIISLSDLDCNFKLRENENSVNDSGVYNIENSDSNNTKVLQKSSFHTTKDFYDINHPFISFKKIIGPERAKRYESPEDAKEFREVDTVLEQTYGMLKQKFDNDQKGFQLLKAEPPKRKYTRKIIKKNFVTSSDEYIEEETKKRKFKEEEESKKRAKKHKKIEKRTNLVI